MNLQTQAPLFYIGKIPIHGDLVLAPMDGISSYPFRSIVRELGSAISYTEFIPAVDAIHGKGRLHEHIYFTEAERPLAYQILDNKPDQLVLAAENLLPHHPDFIDINLGCPAKDVSNRGAGSGLLRTPHLIEQIFAKLTAALPVPVTAKIRLGWDDNSRNYLEVARMIEQNGAALIAVHGRTRQQAYSGSADWDAIAEIKAALSIPVIANGDVRTVADIERIKKHTQCDGVMIGRAALSNPWIFSRLDRHQVTDTMVQQMIHRHLERMVSFYGEEGGLIRFRKHILRYLENFILPADRRLQMITTTSSVEFLTIADDFVQNCPHKQP